MSLILEVPTGAVAIAVLTSLSITQTVLFSYYLGTTIRTPNKISIVEGVRWF